MLSAVHYDNIRSESRDKQFQNDKENKGTHLLRISIKQA